MLVLLVGVLLRVGLLDTPMGFDESDTFDYFASRNYFSLLTDYTAPNNHILHTALVRSSYLLFGDAPWALRLPALMAGLAVLPLTYVLSCWVLGPQAALIATALAATHPGLIRYATNSRGYSFIVMATVVVYLAAKAMSKRRSIAAWLVFVASGIAGMFAIPVMAYSLASASVWAFWEAVRERRRALAVEIGVAAIAVVAGTAALYAPAAARTGAQKIVANRYVEPVERAKAPLKLEMEGRRLVELWSNHVPGVVTLGFLILGIVGITRSETRKLALATIGTPLVLIAISMRIAYARVLLFAVPIACLTIGVVLAKFAPRRFRLASVVIAFGLGTLVWTGRTQSPSILERRVIEGGEIAEELLRRAGPKTGVYAAIPLSEPVRYKFLTNGRSRDQVVAPDVVTGRLPPADGWNRLLVARMKREFSSQGPGRWLDIDDPAFAEFDEPVQVRETEFYQIYRMSRARSSID